MLDAQGNSIPPTIGFGQTFGSLGDSSSCSFFNALLDYLQVTKSKENVLLKLAFSGKNRDYVARSCNAKYVMLVKVGTTRKSSPSSSSSPSFHTPPFSYLKLTLLKCFHYYQRKTATALARRP